MLRSIDPIQFWSRQNLRRPIALSSDEKMIIIAGKKFKDNNRMLLSRKTTEIQIFHSPALPPFAKFPRCSPRQAGEWRMLLKVLPSALTEGYGLWEVRLYPHHETQETVTVSCWYLTKTNTDWSTLGRNTLPFSCYSRSKHASREDRSLRLQIIQVCS